MKRWRITWAALAALALAGGAFGLACAFSHHDFPPDSCTTDVDCFQGQGEYCNQTIDKCEQRPDAAPHFDARPRPDADKTPDATPSDASPFDAAQPDAAKPDAM